MIDALTAKNALLEVRGTQIEVRRPTVADYVALVDAGKRDVYLPAWYVWNHVVRDGRRVYATLEEVMSLDGAAVRELSTKIDQLYTEGLD